MEQERFSVEIKYNGKTKTFRSDIEANQFLGVDIPAIMYRQVTPELYYSFNLHKFWDDYTEMTGEEWAKVATELLSNF